MHLLLALDGSEASERAAAFVDELIPLTGREVTTILVQSGVPPSIDGWVMHGTPVASVGHGTTDVARRLEAERLVAQRVDQQAPEDAELEVRYGDVADTIVTVADELEVDLIVVGTHDRSVLDRLLTGSVSSKVTRKAAQPVLVVR